MKRVAALTAAALLNAACGGRSDLLEGVAVDAAAAVEASPPVDPCQAECPDPADVHWLDGCLVTEACLGTHCPSADRPPECGAPLVCTCNALWSCSSSTLLGCTDGCPSPLPDTDAPCHFPTDLSCPLDDANSGAFLCSCMCTGLGLLTCQGSSTCP